MVSVMETLEHDVLIWLEALCPERNIARRYSIAVSQDLFGHSIVEFAWGRLGSRGRVRTASFASLDRAKWFAARLLRRRASAPKRIGVSYQRV